MKKRFRIFPFLCLVALVILSVSADAKTQTTSLKLDAAGIEYNARLVNLRFDRPNGLISLDNTELIEDDGPATGVPEGYDYRGDEWKEDLKKGIVIKKILMVDNPEAWSGRLVFKALEVKGNMTPLHISLNGVEFIRPASRFSAPFAKQFVDTGWDRWYYVDLPVGNLKQGANEVLMRADSDSTSWCVLISLEEEFARGSLTRSHHPNRSMKSSDGGRTFSDTHLGGTDSVDGEYSIRFSLDHYVKSGEYISPVIDLIDNGSTLKRNVTLTNTQITIDMDVPGNTGAQVFTRFGASPLADDPSWTEWRTADSARDITGTAGKRYFQWKAELSTADRLKTPSIRKISISAEWEDKSPNINAGVAVKVIHNGCVARSSYPFVYENLLHDGLKKFRKNHKLDKIVEGATTEFETMMRLLNWSYRIPVSSDQYSWNWNDITVIEKGEKGMPRLQEQYEGRRRDAMCLYSNQALIGALLAMGYQARHINIHSEGVSGHEVTEVWSNEFNKWFYLDATRDYYYFDPDTGIPHNLLEIHNLLKQHIPRVETLERPYTGELADQIGHRIHIGMREGNNSVSIVDHGIHLMETMGYFRIIPRNDFLSNPLPVPVHTGATMWGWDGFLNHYDEKFPKRYEYQMQTDRAIDFYEPLNQAQVFLTETDEPGLLTVEVDTFTPGGFDTFLVSVNDGTWVEQKEPSWLWNLRSGLNRIDVRTRNIRQVLGPVSTLNVTYNP